MYIFKRSLIRSILMGISVMLMVGLQPNHGMEADPNQDCSLEKKILDPKETDKFDIEKFLSHITEDEGSSLDLNMSLRFRQIQALQVKKDFPDLVDYFQKIPDFNVEKFLSNIKGDTPLTQKCRQVYALHLEKKILELREYFKGIPGFSNYTTLINYGPVSLENYEKKFQSNIGDLLDLMCMCSINKDSLDGFAKIQDPDIAKFIVFDLSNSRKYYQMEALQNRKNLLELKDSCSQISGFDMASFLAQLEIEEPFSVSFMQCLMLRQIRDLQDLNPRFGSIQDPQLSLIDLMKSNPGYIENLRAERDLFELKTFFTSIPAFQFDQFLGSIKKDGPIPLKESQVIALQTERDFIKLMSYFIIEELRTELPAKIMFFTYFLNQQAIHSDLHRLFFQKLISVRLGSRLICRDKN